MTTRGLTLGKFAPFHDGHRTLSEAALAEVDELVVLAYDVPSVTTIPLAVRDEVLPDERIEEIPMPQEIGWQCRSRERRRARGRVRATRGERCVTRSPPCAP